MDKLVDDLKKEKLQIWQDKWEISPGSSIVKEINDGLENSHQLLVVLSRNSIASTWVEDEWTTKYGEQIAKGTIIVLPVLIDNLAPADIPIILRGKKYLNFYENYEEELKVLVHFIKKEKEKLAVRSVIDGEVGEAMINSIKSHERWRPTLEFCKYILNRLETSKSLTKREKIDLVLREVGFYVEEEELEEKRVDDEVKEEASELLVLTCFLQSDNVRDMRRLQRKLKFIALQEEVDEVVYENLISELRYIVKTKDNKQYK